MAKSKRAEQAPVPQHEVIIVPLNQLILSASNVRKHYDPKAIEHMAESIAHKGLLHPLVARPVSEPDGVQLYEIPAGGRRLRALQLLLKQNRIAPDFPVSCTIKTTGVAEDDSLTENVMRENLHPVDEFRAMSAMQEKGMSESAIAASYRVTPAYVKQQLKLASVSPKLLDACVDGKLTIEQLRAFTVIHDHKKQEAVFKKLKNAPAWETHAHAIKRALTEDTLDADNPRVRFVGLATYEAAGGLVHRDLFNSQHEGYVADIELLDRLVGERLAAAQGAAIDAGWKWAVAAVEIPYAESSGLRRLAPLLFELSSKDEKRIKKLEKERDGLADEDGNLTDEADERFDAINAEIAGIQNPPPKFSAADMARAGVFISLDHEGNLDYDYGYVKAEDVSEADTPSENEEDGIEPLGDDTGIVDGSVYTARSEEPAAPENGLKPLSESLVQDLTSFRTVAIRNALGADFNVAFAAVLHTMCLSHFYHAGFESCLQISCNGSFFDNAEGLNAWPTTKELKDRDVRLKALLPENRRDLWDALLAMPDDNRQALFAHCAAMTVNAVRQKHNARSEAQRHANNMVTALGMDMANTWEAGADNYLNRVSKPHIVEAVREAKGDNTAELLVRSGMKKDGMAREAERLLQGTRWLPEPLRSAEQAAPLAEASAEVTDLPAFLTQGEGDAAAA